MSSRKTRRSPRRPSPPGEAAPAEPVDSGDDLVVILEALLFAAHEPLPLPRLRQVLPRIRPERVAEALEEVRARLARNGAPYTLVQLAGGYRLVTLPEFAPYLARLFHKAEKERLSPAALETLAIIAYRQPVTRGDVEGIRGVQAAPVLRALQERRLIKVVGRAPVVGRPQQYGTTRKFLDVFGLASLEELPKAFGPEPTPAPAANGHAGTPPARSEEEGTPEPD